MPCWRVSWTADPSIPRRREWAKSGPQRTPISNGHLAQRAFWGFAERNDMILLHVDCMGERVTVGLHASPKLEGHVDHRALMSLGQQLELLFDSIGEVGIYALVAGETSAVVRATDDAERDDDKEKQQNE